MRKVVMCAVLWLGTVVATQEVRAMTFSLKQVPSVSSCRDQGSNDFPSRLCCYGRPHCNAGNTTSDTCGDWCDVCPGCDDSPDLCPVDQLLEDECCNVLHPDLMCYQTHTATVNVTRGGTDCRALAIFVDGCETQKDSRNNSCSSCVRDLWDYGHCLEDSANRSATHADAFDMAAALLDCPEVFGGADYNDDGCQVGEEYSADQHGSGLVLDACGVCDGDGSSCAGCDGLPNTPLTGCICPAPEFACYERDPLGRPISTCAALAAFLDGCNQEATDALYTFGHCIQDYREEGEFDDGLFRCPAFFGATSSFVSTSDDGGDRLSGGAIATAVILPLLFVTAVLVFAVWHKRGRPDWGGDIRKRIGA